MLNRIPRSTLALSLAIVACGSDPEPTGQGNGSAGTNVPAPGAGTPSSGLGAGDGSAGQGANDTGGSAPGVTPPAGSGSGATPPATTDNDPTQLDPGTGEPPPIALDECGLSTRFPGDEYCILPPPPDQGFQVHIGPADYDNPDPRYVLEPGEETNMYFDARSGNREAIFFYHRQYRMRPGSHHMIVSQAGGAGGGGFGAGVGEGRRLGGSQNLAKDNPDHGVVAPENEGIGIPLDPNVPLSVNLHYINTSDQPVLQEAWVNFWYKDEAEVTERAHEMFLLGSVTFQVQPRATTTLGPYSCNVSGSGRILSMYGHRHANSPRFTAWRVRGGQREMIYESLNWKEPLVLEYNSLVQNALPDRGAGIEGGMTGIVDLQPGDQLEWECYVVNETDGVLRFSNETFTGEMCILVGDTVGTTVSCGPGF